MGHEGFGIEVDIELLRGGVFFFFLREMLFVGSACVLGFFFFLVARW